MNNKIQMTEEQAKQMYLECGDMGNGWKLFVERAKEKGYIRKNPVEEAEEMYLNMCKEGYEDGVHEKLYEAIQYLKRSHPEFKEESDE